MFPALQDHRAQARTPGPLLALDWFGQEDPRFSAHLLYELQVLGVCQMTRRDVAVVASIPQGGKATRWRRDPQQRRTFAARPV